MTGRLLHTGQVLLDLVMRVPALPPVGGDVLASSTSLLPGGGFNVLAAAARAGAAVCYLGGHGTGELGDRIRTALAGEGVEVAFEPTGRQDTGICVVLLDRTGERTFVTGSGAEFLVDAAALAGIRVDGSDLVYISGYSMLAAEKAAVLLDWLDRVRPTRVLLDPGPLAAEIQPSTWSRLLARTWLLSCNARESALLTGSDDPAKGTGALLTRLPGGAAVVVRDGPAGCLLNTGGGPQRITGFRTTALDTNGAGDAHCGVLAAELLRGATLPEAALRANAAAAIAVTRLGPATAPTRTEVDHLLTTP